jgi:hypothetical protein
MLGHVRFHAERPDHMTLNEGRRWARGVISEALAGPLSVFWFRYMQLPLHEREARGRDVVEADLGGRDDYKLADMCLQILGEEACRDAHTGIASELVLANFRAILAVACELEAREQLSYEQVGEIAERFADLRGRGKARRLCRDCRVRSHDRRTCPKRKAGGS